jgi:hypothetical protein
VFTADLGFTGGKNDIGAGTDTDFIGACTPALTRTPKAPNSQAQCFRVCLAFDETFCCALPTVLTVVLIWMLYRKLILAKTNCSTDAGFGK